jgi:hypothetical protein
MVVNTIAYQREPTELRDVVLRQGFITPLQLFRIVAWKSAKGMASMTLNTELDIRERTAAAVDLAREWEGVDVVEEANLQNWDDWRETARAIVGRKHGSEPAGLLALHGIGYPVATAILSIINPKVWPVIDKWSVASVFGEAINTQRAYFADQYEVFARHLATVGASSWPTANTVHELDQAAMRAGDPRSTESLPPNWTYALLV